MKELYIIRHAKSDWNDATLSDFDRPLNKRGLRNAPDMGARMRKRGIRPDRIISSPALRAKTTAEFFARELGIDAADIRYERSIYEASIQSLLYLVAVLPDEAERIFLFGHNPGFSGLADALGSTPVGDLPTAAVVGIRFEADHWNDAARMRGEVILFDYPKNGL